MNYSSFLKTEMWNLLSNLRADSPAHWGIMSAQHMVEHLQMVFAMSLGFGKIKPFFDEERTRRSYESIIIQKNPLPRNLKFKNGLLAEPLPLEAANLEQAIQNLRAMVDAFFERFEEPNLTTLHPVLGVLNVGDWDIFHTAHVTHHFIQFGLIAE